MEKLDRQYGFEMATDVEHEKAKDKENGLKQRDEVKIKEKKKQRIYSKEATVIVDISNVQNGGAVDIIGAITEKIGVEKILAVRPKMNKQYEVTFETEDVCDELINGLEIKGQICGIKKLQDREFVVSFMHLPVYLGDKDIIEKLEGWGVTPKEEIKRRFYPGTEIEDGTRFVKVKFPKEVASLPYSTRFDTAEGSQYFRIIHSQQVKTCRLCISPEHILKDCPEFKCFKCDQQGHFARDCTAIACPDCGKPLSKCECWMGNNEEVTEEQQQMDGQVYNETAEMTEEFEKIENKQQELTENEEYQQQKHQGNQDREEEGIDDTTEITEQETTDEKEVKEKEERMERKELDINQQKDKKDKEKSGLTARRKSLKVKPNLNVARRKKGTEIDFKKLEMVQECDNG